MSTHPSLPNYYYGSHQQQQLCYNQHIANYLSFGGSGSSYTAVDIIIDDVYVVNYLNELIQTNEMLPNINYITGQLTDQERNSNAEFDSLYVIVFHILDDMYDHDHVEKEDSDNNGVLKYLKIRAHHAPSKDGVNPKVVGESEICAIYQSEYEDEENIGTLQCGHKYHTITSNSGC
ncbi:hypothetical protein P3S67_021495 [Capsicum chacoense]